MKFYVTYLVMDGNLANPLWHAGLVFSYLPEEGEKIEVQNAYGYYAAPPSDTESYFFKFKKLIKMPYDFTGNHGVLKKEEIRFLDKGIGLNGVTFEVNFEQYCLGKKICTDMLRDQEAAINEWTRKLRTPDHVPTSAEIFSAEKEDAEIHKRPSRLYPFDFRVGVDFTPMGLGLNLNPSHTCKTMDLNILRQMGIPEEQLLGITQHHTSNTIPRYSGDLKPVFFHSDGVRHPHKHAAGNVTFFRKWEDAKVYWSAGPENVYSVNPNPFAIDEDQRYYMQLYISQLQRIEQQIVDAELDPEFKSERERLVTAIIGLYNKFATVSNKMSYDEIQGYIDDAKYFLNNIYFAINDNWETDEVETVASKLPYKVQSQICQLMGRSIAKSPTPTNPEPSPINARRAL